MAYSCLCHRQGRKCYSVLLYRFMLQSLWYSIPPYDKVREDDEEDDRSFRSDGFPEVLSYE